MGCAVPVISSNNSSLPEVIGKGGILVDPDRPDEILEAMKEIFSSKDLAETLREEGKKQKIKFDWKKTAQETLKLFNKL